MKHALSDELRELVARRAEQLCEYCLIAEIDCYLGCEVDHIIAEKHNGRTVEANLALACVYCNRHKGTDVASVVPGSTLLVRLFNPRSDWWSDHFELVGGRIEWVSSIGEATARLLRFNDIRRIREREMLVLHGKFPRPAAKLRMLIRGKP